MMVGPILSSKNISDTRTFSYPSPIAALLSEFGVSETRRLLHILKCPAPLDIPRLQIFIEDIDYGVSINFHKAFLSWFIHVFFSPVC